MSEKNNKNILYCSFCGKSQHEVRKLIAGPTVFICDECVELCMDIIKEENKSSIIRHQDGLPSPREICEVLDITFYELAKMSQTENEKKGNLLSIEQENILSKEPKLLTIFYLLISGWTPNLIIEEFELAELECHKKWSGD